MNDPRSQLAINIERYREQRGMTKTELAERAGISRPSISHYERGTRRPKIAAVKKIAGALRVSFDTLDPFGVHDLPADQFNAVREEGDSYCTRGVDIPDDLCRQLKQIADAQGLSLEDFLHQTVRSELARSGRL